MKDTSYTPSNSFKNNHIKLIEEHIVLLMVEEYKRIYIMGMTRNDFINKVYHGFDEKMRTREGIALFKRVYSYLSSTNIDNIYTSENNKFIEYETT